MKHSIKEIKLSTGSQGLLVNVPGSTIVNMEFTFLSGYEYVDKNKYEVANPNRKLIQQLKSEGVDFYLCGQTMNARGLEETQILPEVKLALSAMTVIGVYVSKGYALIKF